MFTLSKLVGVALDPGWWLVAGLVAGCLLCWAGRIRAARLPLSLAAVIALVAGVTPAGGWLVGQLEERFPATAVSGPIAGIVVLGGLVDPALSAAREAPALNGAAERLTAFIALARQYPDAKLVFSGGSGSLFNQEIKEAAVLRRLLEGLGIPLSRMLFDDQSRNTHENALLSRALAMPQPGERWLLVTSAMHMPRAMGCFRAAGFAVSAYPVDHRTWPGGGHWLPGLASGLAMIAAGLHEWVGLAVYRLLGRTDSLFPAP